MKIIHLSDWGQQPEIRIGCTQTYHMPWGKNDLPQDIHEADDYLYTFNVQKVTCPKCINLEVFKESSRNLREYKNKVKASGLSQSEYIEKIQTDFINKYKK